MRRPDHAPGPIAWLVAFVSFVLPWLAIAIALLGLWEVTRGEAAGWWYVAAGGTLLIGDVILDLAWARSGFLKTDQPELNQRSHHLVGRVVALEEPIVHGRGRVRIDDTMWTVEGPDSSTGMPVRVTAAEGTLLTVERA